MGPLLSPLEMDGGSVATVAAKLRRAPYAARMAQLFGGSVFATPRLAVAEALFAVARYQIEEPSFHPYTSKFDFWLEGKARLNPAELRGYRLFNDPEKRIAAAAIWISRDRTACRRCSPTASTRPSGAPRNPALAANRNPGYFDLGICGPYRSDMRRDAVLRHVPDADTAQRGDPTGVLPQRRVPLVAEVQDFYDYRDTEPGRVYPRGAGRDGGEV